MSRPALAALAALVVVLAGCAQETQGSPVAEDGPTGQPTGTSEPSTSEPSTSEPSTSEPSTSETETAGGLAGLEPCDLVDAAGVSGLGLTGGEEKTLGEARVCQWRREGATLAESFTVSLSLFDSRGLAEIVGTDVRSLPDIGSHKASSFVAPGGSCGVSIGVGDDARADSTAVGGDQQQGCQLAGQLAALVEPNLP